MWPWFGPPWYEQVEDLDAYLAAYWCALHLSAANWLSCWLAMTREGYLAKAARLTAARRQAQEIISHEYGSPVPEDADVEEYGELIGNGRLRSWTATTRPGRR